MRFVPTERRTRLAAGVVSLTVVGLVAAATASAGPSGERVSNSPATVSAAAVEIGACLQGWTVLSLRNDRDAATYAHVFLRPPEGFEVSREMVASYLDPAYEKQLAIRLTAPEDVAADEYRLRLDQPGTRPVDVPVTIAIDPDQVCLSGDELTATATSEQASAGNEAFRAVDGDPTTIWHTRWTPTRDLVPQSITLELDGRYDVTQLRYLPRTDGSPNGWATDYVIHTSTDGSTFTEVSSGSWEPDQIEDVADFDAQGVRFIKLEITGSTTGHASAAELSLVATRAS